MQNCWYRRRYHASKFLPLPTNIMELRHDRIGTMKEFDKFISLAHTVQLESDEVYDVVTGSCEAMRRVQCAYPYRKRVKQVSH